MKPICVAEWITFQPASWIVRSTPDGGRSYASGLEHLTSERGHHMNFYVPLVNSNSELSNNLRFTSRVSIMDVRDNMLPRSVDGGAHDAAFPAVSPRNSSLSVSPTPYADFRGCKNGALMDSFGIFLQGLLAVVAFSTLMLKRFREPKHERRPWRIWFLDTSKQAIGMLFIHFANVYLSDLTKEDPCSLYLINFLLDASLGMLLIYAGVRAVSAVVEWRQWDSLRFGEYGEPVQCSAWVGQCALYILIMMFEKVLIILVLLIPQWKQLALLNPIENPELELAIVMLIVPFFVNALMFWVVDNFLMRKGRTKAKLEEREGGDSSRGNSKVRYRRALSHDESESEVLISADDEMDESDMEEDMRRLTNLKPIKKKKHRLGLPV